MDTQWKLMEGGGKGGGRRDTDLVGRGMIFLNDQEVPAMGDIERWWRVTARNGRVGTWTDQDPGDRLTAAWTGATVDGPFVPESELRGAVEALVELVRLKDGPRDDAYRAAKDAAWDEARRIVTGRAG